MENCDLYGEKRNLPCLLGTQKLFEQRLFVAIAFTLKLCQFIWWLMSQVNRFTSYLCTPLLQMGFQTRISTEVQIKDQRASVVNESFKVSLSSNTKMQIFFLQKYKFTSLKNICPFCPQTETADSSVGGSDSMTTLLERKHALMTSCKMYIWEKYF